MLNGTKMRLSGQKLSIIFPYSPDEKSFTEANAFL